MTTTKTTTRADHYLKGLVVSAAALLALLALSMPALGKQTDNLQQNALAADKKGAAVAIQSASTTPKATFATGSGASFFGVKVSDHGNLMSFESPQGRENLFSGAEGYELCSNFGNVVNGHDTNGVEGGFGSPKFSQPTRGAFPLTVTRKTTDGKFQLKQAWSKPDPVEKDVTVTMTIKNISGVPINGVGLSRSGDFDVDEGPADQGARTNDSVWQWDDVSRVTTPNDPSQPGVMLTALTAQTVHGGILEARNEWVSGTREKCFANNLTTPTSVQDLAMRASYSLGDFSAGQSKIVKFEYGRM